MSKKLNEASKALYRQLIARIQTLKLKLAETEIELARLHNLIDPPSNSSNEEQFFWNDEF